MTCPICSGAEGWYESLPNYSTEEWVDCKCKEEGSMNWDILCSLADSDAQFQEWHHATLMAIDARFDSVAAYCAAKATHIAHKLMDLADDLDELERQAYDDERMGE